MQVYDRTMPSHSHSHSYSHSRATSPYAPRPSANLNYTTGRRATSPPVAKTARPPSTALFPLPTAAPPPARSQAQSQNIQKTLANSGRRTPARASAASTYPPISSVSAHNRSESPMQFWKPPQTANMQPTRMEVGGGRYANMEEQARRPRSASAAAYASTGGRTTPGVHGQAHGHGVGSSSRQQPSQPQASLNSNYSQRPAVPHSAWPSASDYVGPTNDRPVVPPASKPYPPSHSYANNVGVSHERAYPPHGHGHMHAQEPPVSRASDEPRHWNAREAATAQNIDPTVVPNIHQAIGWWPDRRQQLIWDLTSSNFPQYHRPFDRKDLEGPFSDPPLKHVKILLGEDASLNWEYSIDARRGMEYITLQDVIEQISNLMHGSKVSLRDYRRVNFQTKWAIVRAYCRRTKRPYPQGMSNTELDTRVLAFFEEAMEKTIAHGAPVSWTNLQVMDLLGSKVMFRGLCNIEQANKWLLKTTTKDAIRRGEC